MNVTPQAGLSVATGALVLLGGAGCARETGPIEVRIDTDGVAVSDFVLEWSAAHGSLHDVDHERLDLQVVASEEPLRLESRALAANVTEIVASLVHPAYRYTYGSVPAEGSGTISMDDLRPVAWEEQSADGEKIPASQVLAHLQRVRLTWLPAFEPGRSRLRAYVPLLQALVRRASPPDDAALQVEVERLQETLP